MPSQPTPPSPQAGPPPAGAAAVAPPTAARQAGTGEIGARPSDVFAEDWWTHARPTFEIHGLFRVRAELFHQFALGRREEPGEAVLWEQPPDNSYVDVNGIGLDRSMSNISAGATELLPGRSAPAGPPVE